ncbi:MAG: 1-acyl-sn-glycerol-3-phosphate acyltransferase [Marinovum sp.]|nr:1-acyl-sn-glycerol-3-phosphate acyltransferase [Marinovum sp.]
MTTWQSPQGDLQIKAISLLGWCIAIMRIVPMFLVIFGGLLLLLLLRIFEKPLFGHNRPITPLLTQVVCRLALRIMGIKHQIGGRPMTNNGAVVANHSSWLDIFTLNAAQRVYFVSKSEVAAWPGIGWLARATGTGFIKRDRRQAKLQRDILSSRLQAGHKLLFFPEGTSTDGRQVLPFKSTLFAALFEQSANSNIHVQPVSVVYKAPKGCDDRFYGWWGDMAFDAHFLLTLSTWRQGRVEVVFSPPVAIAEFASRKELSKYLQSQVSSAHQQATSRLKSSP